jgi:hypothetical protein
MNKLLSIVLVLLSALAWADKQESVDVLKARAEKANRKDQVELYTKIAERQLEALDQAYDGGAVQQAREALSDVVNYGVKAAHASSETGKRMKQTEIAMRKMSLRLEAIRKTLDIDERAPVGEAVQKLEAARTDLLHRMFRK